MQATLTLRMTGPLVAAALLAFPTLAMAHGPSRQKLIESVEINAPAEKVWAKIGNFQDMSWHPAIEKTEGRGGNEKGATRQLTLKGGGVIEESLEKHDNGKMSYNYRITNVEVKVLPVTNYSSWLTVEPEEGGKSKVEWKGAFYRGYPNNDPPADLNDEAAVKAVTGVYRAGLDALKKSLEAGGS
jgi:hypothetical protein